MEHFSSPRWFSLHDYYPSFHMLLLRSRPLTAADQNVIDIIFRGVFYVELRSDLDGVMISEASDEEAAQLDKRADLSQRYEANRYFVLTSREQRYRVGAHLYYVEENNLTRLRLRPTSCRE